MPQAEALNLLAITLMVGMSSPPSSPTTQAVVTQQQPHLEAAQARDHIESDQDRLRALIPIESTSVQVFAPAVTDPAAATADPDQVKPAGH